MIGKILHGTRYYDQTRDICVNACVSMPDKTGKCGFDITAVFTFSHITEYRSPSENFTWPNGEF